MCSELRENPSNILVTHSHFVKIEYSIRVFHQHVPFQFIGQPISEPVIDPGFALRCRVEAQSLTATT